MIGTTIDFGLLLLIIDVNGIDGQGVVWEYYQNESANIPCDVCGEFHAQVFVSYTGEIVGATHVLVVPSLEVR